jgi:hypothetical protein
MPSSGLVGGGDVDDDRNQGPDVLYTSNLKHVVDVGEEGHHQWGCGGLLLPQHECSSVSTLTGGDDAVHISQSSDDNDRGAQGGGDEHTRPGETDRGSFHDGG